MHLHNVLVCFSTIDKFVHGGRLVPIELIIYITSYYQLLTFLINNDDYILRG